MKTSFKNFVLVLTLSTLFTQQVLADALLINDADGAQMAQVYDAKDFASYLPGLDPVLLNEVLSGKAGLLKADCGCYNVTKVNGQDQIQSLARVQTQGLSSGPGDNFDAYNNAIRACMKLSSTQSHDQADRVAVASCQFSPGETTADLKKTFQSLLDDVKKRDADAKAALEDSERWWPANYIPNFIKVIVSGLAGGMLWSSRGGNPSFMQNFIGGTMGARFLFGYAGYAVINCLVNAKSFDQCQDAIIGDALGAIPLLAWGWDENGGINAQTGKFSTSQALMDDGDMYMRGLLQNTFEIEYMKARGYNTDNLVYGGLQMGTCFGGAGLIGDLKTKILVNNDLGGHTQYGEFCFGVSKGVSESVMFIQKNEELKNLQSTISVSPDFWENLKK